MLPVGGVHGTPLESGTYKGVVYQRRENFPLVITKKKKLYKYMNLKHFGPPDDFTIWWPKRQFRFPVRMVAKWSRMRQVRSTANRPYKGTPLMPTHHAHVENATCTKWLP